MTSTYPYTWAWLPQFEVPGRDSPMRGRKGQRLRVIVRGGRNSALVEFNDGFQAVVSRNGIRKTRSGSG